MRIRNLALAGSIATVAVAGVMARASDEADTGPDIAFLESLEGEWLRIDEAGVVTDEVISSMRLTAAGTAMLETLFPGTEKEMITVYHRAGEDLVLTHYCMLGNQPRMRARCDTGKGTLDFECTGVGNAASEDAQHIHHGKLWRTPGERLRIEWLMFENGSRKKTIEYELARRGDPLSSTGGR